MKKALIGLSNNIENNYQKIKNWALSFKEHSDADIILLCANSTSDELLKVLNLGLIAIPVVIEDTWFINHKRLIKTAEYIRDSKYELILITDVFDVIFQSDPFSRLDTSYDIFVGGEGILVSDEPWNSDNINKLFPQDYAKCTNTEIICSGVIAGKKQPLVDLLMNMYELCENSSNNHNIKDQAALIVLFSKNLIPNIKLMTLDDCWAVHCAVAGPTQFFEAWGFKQKLRYKIPHLKDGKIYSDEKMFDIVHQFNRIPEWNEILTKKYE